MDLVHNGGGGGGSGVLAESTFHVFFTNNVKIISKNGEKIIKQLWEKNIVHIWFFGILGGLFQVGFLTLWIS